MKTLGSLALLGAALVTAAPYSLADTIQVGSFATGAVVPAGDMNTAMNFAGFSATSTTPMTGTGATYTLSPGTTWGAAVPNSTWVGYAATAGPGGTDPALGYYTFNTAFTAVGGTSVYGGTLEILADDTAEVFLNGTLLASFGALGSDGHCADGQPSCEVADVLTLGGLHLNSGTDANTLTFVVQQAGNPAPGIDPSGLDFDANFTMAPEPSSLLLLGTGMLGAAGLLLWQRRRKEAREHA